MSPSKGGRCVLTCVTDERDLASWDADCIASAADTAAEIIEYCQTDADTRDQRTNYRVWWDFDGIVKGTHLLRVSPSEDDGETNPSIEGALKLQLRHNEGLVATIVRMQSQHQETMERILGIVTDRLATLEAARGEALEAEREAALVASSQDRLEVVARVGEKLVGLLQQGAVSKEDADTLRAVAKHPMVKQLVEEQKTKGKP